MVSNVLDLTAEELLARLRQLRRDYADDPDYTALRAALPADWPI
jgi:hypothetical protein